MNLNVWSTYEKKWSKQSVMTDPFIPTCYIQTCCTYFIFVYLMFISLIVLCFLHSTSVLSFYIDEVLTLSLSSYFEKYLCIIYICEFHSTIINIGLDGFDYIIMTKFDLGRLDLPELSIYEQIEQTHAGTCGYIVGNKHVCRPIRTQAISGLCTSYGSSDLW